jgi:hypothetical protein
MVGGADQRGVDVPTPRLLVPPAIAGPGLAFCRGSARLLKKKPRLRRAARPATSPPSSRWHARRTRRRACDAGPGSDAFVVGVAPCQSSGRRGDQAWRMKSCCSVFWYGAPGTRVRDLPLTLTFFFFFFFFCAGHGPGVRPGPPEGVAR